MDANAEGEPDPPLPFQARIQRGHCIEHLQAGTHSPPGIVLMGLGPAKIDQEPIAEQLGYIAFKALDHFGTGRLIGPYHLAQLLGVELFGERRGTH
jgi:hypothetical protein